MESETNSRQPAVIRLPVRSVDSLLDVGGSPILGPRIHPEAAHAIFFDAKEVRRNLFQIEIAAPRGDLGRSSEVESAVRNHFLTQERDLTTELQTAMRRGFLSLLFAMLVVALMVVLSEWLQTLGTGRIFSLLGESLVIVGWVTLWIPAETLIFEQFAIREKRNLARALRSSRVVLTPLD